MVTIERQGSQLKITCVNADAGNESNDLETLHWYKDEKEIVVWKRSTDTATMGKEVRINSFCIGHTQTFNLHDKGCDGTMEAGNLDVQELWGGTATTNFGFFEEVFCNRLHCICDYSLEGIISSVPLFGQW